MKVAIRLGSLGTGSLKKDIQRSLAIGVHGLQLRVVDNELDPRELSGSGREDLADYIESFGFELSALSGELGGYADSATVDERVERTRAMLMLCADLRCPVLCVDPGIIPESGTQRHDEYIGALRDLARYALDRNARLALTTGDQPADQLIPLLSSVGCEGLCINYDSAALVSRGFDPVSALKPLAPNITHVQARDAARGTALEPGEERNLSKGDAAIEEMLAILRNTGYSGYLSVATARDEDLPAFAVESVTWLKKQDGVEP